jgi:hypothetical protein
VRRWTDKRARLIAVSGLILLMSSRRVSHMPELRTRFGRWCYVTTGLTHAYLQALLADPITDEKPSRSALVGYGRGQSEEVAEAFRARRPLPDGGIAELSRGNHGYIVALKMGGFCYSKQPRKETGDAFFGDELGTESGFAPARYFIIGRPIDPSVVPDRHRLDLAVLEAMGFHDLGDDRRATRTQRLDFRRSLAEPRAAPD